MVLGGLETTVHRNYFGSQLGSFVGTLNILESTKNDSKGVFIRAPVIVKHSNKVTVLATVAMPSTGSNEGVSASNTAQEAIVAVKQVRKNNSRILIKLFVRTIY